MFRSAGREIINAAYRLAHVFQDRGRIGKGGQFDLDLSQAFAGGADNPLGAGNTYYALFNSTVYVFRHFLGRRPGRPHLDGHRAQVDVGVDLDGNLLRRQQTPDDQECHEQVGGNGVSGKISDES